MKIYIDKTEYKEKKIEKAIYEYLRSNDYCIPLKTGLSSIPVNKIGTADFGVPQRRDRVIIVGGSYDLTCNFHMEAISTVQKDGQRSLLPTVIGAEDAIGDLPELTPGEDGSSYPYKFPASNAYQKFMRGEIDAEEYLKTYKE